MLFVFIFHEQVILCTELTELYLFCDCESHLHTIKFAFVLYKKQYPSVLKVSNSKSNIGLQSESLKFKIRYRSNTKVSK
jgi:hypothetical protein